MDHDSYLLKYTSHKISSQNNQDVNAIAIDSMLVNIRIIFKRIIYFRKILKQIQQQQQQQDENNNLEQKQFMLIMSMDRLNDQQIDEKILMIQSESKSLALNLSMNIPPDKRMTSLFYLRICKQINYYKTILQSLQKILPVLQETYAMQLKDCEYSIVDLYVICEKKIIQEVIMLKKKIINLLQEMKKKNQINKVMKSTKSQRFNSNANGNVINNKNGGDCNKNDKNNNDVTQLQSKLIKSKKHLQSASNNKNQNSSSQPYDDSNLPMVMRRASKIQLFSDFKQKIPMIFDQIYSCLDLGLPQILDFYVPTLRPEDNIDIIYRKQSQRNKKSRKQIKQFQGEYYMFLDRKAYMLKRKQIRRKKSLLKNNNMTAIGGSNNGHNVHNGNNNGNKQNNINLQEKKINLIIPERKRVMSEAPEISEPHKKSALFMGLPLSPVVVKADTEQRKQRNKSKLRERIENSISNSKQTNNIMQKSMSGSGLKFDSMPMKLGKFKTGHNSQHQSQGSSPNKQNIIKSSMFSNQHSKKKLLKLPSRKQLKSKSKGDHFKKRLKL